MSVSSVNFGITVDDLTRRFQAMDLDHNVRMNQEPSDYELSFAQRPKLHRPGQQDDNHLGGGLINTFCARLIRRDAIIHFAQNFESIFGSWSILLRETTPTGNIRCTDSKFIAAFRALDQVIASGNSTRGLSRLAHVQLVHVFELLQSRVVADRKAGRLHRRSGYRNASVALDIYMSAQDSVSSPISRRTLIERKRRGKRWGELAGPWPLFLLVYSEEAEDIVQSRQMPDTTMLRLIAARVFRESPSFLLETCELAAEAVEAAVVANRPMDNQIARKLLERQFALQEHE